MNKSQPERLKLEISKETARELAWSPIDKEYEDFKVVSNKIIDTTRWSTIHDLVIQRVSDGKFFATSYSSAATECQDEKPFEYNEPDFTEVFPVEKTVIIYE